MKRSESGRPKPSAAARGRTDKWGHIDSFTKRSRSPITGAAWSMTAGLLLCACASVPLTPIARPAWAKEQRLWIDPKPDPDSQRAEVRDCIVTAAKELALAGFEAGTSGDAESVTVRVGEEFSLTSTTPHRVITARLMSRGKEIDIIHFDGRDLSCSSMAQWSNDGECLGKELAARIAGSQPLASLHAAPATAAGAVAAAPSDRMQLKGRLAVLELRLLTRDLTTDNARYFTDLVRAGTLKYAPQAEVMTRENLLTLLQASGKDLASCEGECEVETGRLIGADLIISGEVQKVGTRYKLTLRLHETHQGRLLSAAAASGSTIDQLDDEASKATAQLFGSL